MTCDRTRLYQKLTHAAARWVRRNNEDTREDLLGVAEAHGEEQYAKGRREAFREADAFLRTIGFNGAASELRAYVERATPEEAP